MQQKQLIANLLNYFLRDNFIGAEIGVDHAETTVHLLENCPKLTKLYAIDPYFKREERHTIVKELLEKYNNAHFLRLTSDDAAKQMPTLDFVYIDGDHSYNQVVKDLNNYVPKIRSGGLLLGHDWTSVRTDFGVVKAAQEYLHKYKEQFKPLFTNEELQTMGFPQFKRGGWSEQEKRHLIHKKRPSAFPLWWLVKT